MRPTVLIVDDFAAFRSQARELLEADGFDVVGEAADGDAAVAAVESLQPQVVLLDVQLGGPDGFSVAERLGGGNSDPAVVLTSSHDARSFRRRLAASRVRGFIPKAELSGERLAELLR